MLFAYDERSSGVKVPALMAAYRKLRLSHTEAAISFVEIAAVTGRRSLKQTQRYTKGVE
jgi:hypothetical protein